MGAVPPILRLSNELLRHILAQIEPDPERTVPIDDRRFISVESFDILPPVDSSKDIGNFRLVCRRFAEIGAPLLFTLVIVRFSKAGLARLARFAEWRHLTVHVKKFSYLMPFFYQNAESLRIPPQQNGRSRPNVQSLRKKAIEQHEIIQTKYDANTLKTAFATFRSLQFVKLLPVAEEDDRRFKEYVQINGTLRNFIDQYWAPAIIHGSRTVGDALLSADIPWSKLYLPVESVQSVEFLALSKPPSVSILASRLTCLTLVFDEGNNVEEHIKEESYLLKTVFESAKNMQAVHIGFPRNRPVSLPLEDVFHHVTWEKLIAFGVAGWDLDAKEIIALVRRHVERLRGLRLRDVHLKDGMWKDVLPVLRYELLRLKWVSLRRIGYAPQSDEAETGGAEVPDDQPWTLSDSDDEDDMADDADGLLHDGNGHVDAHESNANGEDSFDDGGSDNGRHEHEDNATEFPDDLESPTTSAPILAARTDGLAAHAAEELHDDGTAISNSKRKAWEKWVVARHDETTLTSMNPG